MVKTKKKKTGTQNYQVHSLERGLDLIEILAHGEKEKTLTQLCEQAGFNMTTAYRIMSALVSRGYARKMPVSNKYRLGYKVFELGAMAAKNLNLKMEADPILLDLAIATHETAYLLIIDNKEALCLSRIDCPDNIIKVLVVDEGERMPLHLGAAPKVLFAYLTEEEIDAVIEQKGLTRATSKSIIDRHALKKKLQEIREQGYALSIDDVVEDVFALGCPVKNSRREVIAAISISGLYKNFNDQKVQNLLQKLKAASEALAAKLA